MSVKYICDGCGKEEPAVFYPSNHSSGFHKPELWFQRSDAEGIQVACSRECIEVIAKKTGKTAVVLPI